ncbi:gephyrin-like molybdotransferase Glp [Rubellimicrobium roseum]|uniref:Molybdopterin molybdenumtransferase n=1 Tax=Rubellimicrobium roseum TaxID=687525 RepID=A0A5C4NBS2_9RHOB|nr:gephyrin-like molybdotransferase Glp [Rubellimicrobium roseum]TNC63231.1 molybdopterin molybdotransferase MoeA [Rubellimicrobium roseum]
MISVAEALDRLFALAPTPVPEEVPLLDAAGRVLLRPVAARRDQPPFAASAMDGYALRAADVSPGAVLCILGESAAGRRFEGRVGPGEATRILTGAPLPQGADAVVIQEEVRRDGDRITISDTAIAAHVRPAANDFAAGSELSAPRRLSPADVALLAAFGAARVTVGRRPTVAIISTGDELVMPGEEPGPDQIFAANAFGLHALLAAEGARPRLLPIAGDRPEALALAFDLAHGADLVLTIGGASVGDHDLVAPAAQAAGARLDFHKVAMRPGKPLLAGRMPDGSMLLGLPGNPVSAMVCGLIFLLPVIRAMQGLLPGPAPRERRRLAVALRPGGPREHYLRAVLDRDGSVRPFDRQDSSLLSVLGQADGLVAQPPDALGQDAGEMVDFVPFRRNT